MPLNVICAGTCTGKSQFPCKDSLPSDDGCSSAQPPQQLNQGGIAPADGQGSSKTTQVRWRLVCFHQMLTLPGSLCAGSSCGTALNSSCLPACPSSALVAYIAMQEAAKAASRFNRNDLAAARLDVSGQQQSKALKKGEACGDKNGKWGSAKCETGSECKQKGSGWACM